jgi:hypothetical protein
VIYAGLSGRSPLGLPTRFALPDGRVHEIPAATAAVLQQAAADALAAAASP